MSDTVIGHIDIDGHDSRFTEITLTDTCVKFGCRMFTKEHIKKMLDAMEGVVLSSTNGTARYTYRWFLLTDSRNAFDTPYVKGEWTVHTRRTKSETRPQDFRILNGVISKVIEWATA